MTELHPSADGRGRTLWEIMTGKNKKDLTPLELQYHNPLEAKVGCTVQFTTIPEYQGVNFVIEGIHVYKTTVRGKDFYHTDYCCKGNARDWDKPRRVRLRLTPDEDSMNQLGHSFQLLKLYAEFEWDESFEQMCLENGDHNPDWDDEGEVTFKVNYDDDDNEMDEPWRYWRVDEAVDPYQARVTSLTDDDGSGTIEDDELEHNDTTYWDFSRIVVKDDEEETEVLWIEKDVDTNYFTLLRGTPVHPNSVTII